MPPDPTLDIPALTAPIAGADPAGGTTPFDVREKLDEARREVDPSAFAADDPTRPAEAKRADWAAAIRVATDSLTTKAKDLLVAARLTEAATQRFGFAGLRDGLRLLTALLADCWDRLAPKIDDPSDLDLRAGPFEWLDDADHGGRFPSTVRGVPLFPGGDVPLGWLTWRRGQEGRDKAAAEAFEKGAAAAPPAAVQDTLAVLGECKAARDALAAKLTERLGDLAPGMTQLGRAIDDCRALVELIAQRKGPAPAADPAPPDAAPAGAQGAGAPPPAAAAPATRDAAYRQLAEAARVLEALEPHSPVPYLVRRAVALGALPFHEMIKSFVRDSAVVAELERELAIDPPPAAE
ncbi:type VI secretion system protein TssA [Gemmata sp.]|uniref:type VI secretion system protein TssA n=1 Tax=Gemmata sp. TaxID=1914242 RepID=UPI003F719C90